MQERVVARGNDVYTLGCETNEMILSIDQR